MFLTVVISVIKDFDINDSDGLEFYRYVKRKWFCIKSSLESALRKPVKAACGIRSNRAKSFSKNKARSFHKF